MLEEKGNEEKPVNALYEHVGFFKSNNDGTLTTKSMIKKHTEMGDEKWTVPYKVDAIIHMLDDNHYKHNVESMMKIINPASSGIWDPDGNFDSDVFNELASKAITFKGKEIITKKIFKDFVKARHPNGIHPQTATNIHILGCVPYEITWEKVTQGSIDEIFEYFHDASYNHHGKKEQAITVEKLRNFYQHPANVMQELIDKKSKLANEDLEHRVTSCPYSSSL